MGDDVAGASDYDILAVTEGNLTTEDLSAFEALHRHLLREYPDAERLEGDYAPRHLLAARGTTAPVPGFARGRFAAEVAEIMLSADNLANMRMQGVHLHGFPATEVLPEVTPHDVRAAVLGMLREGPAACTTEGEAADAVLNLVRSLCALQTERPTTKSEGVRWALAHLDERWCDVVRRADAIRRGLTSDQSDRTLRRALPGLDRAVRDTVPLV
jgi:hypothetical protein